MEDILQVGAIASTHGVRGGIAEYFDVDPTLVRLGAVLLGCSGTGILVYIVAAVIIPERRY